MPLHTKKDAAERKKRRDARGPLKDRLRKFFDRALHDLKNPKPRKKRQRMKHKR